MTQRHAALGETVSAARPVDCEKALVSDYPVGTCGFVALIGGEVQCVKFPCDLQAAPADAVMVTQPIEGAE